MAMTQNIWTQGWILGYPIFLAKMTENTCGFFLHMIFEALHNLCSFPVVSSGFLPNFTPLRSPSMPQGHGVPVASRLWLHQEIGLPRCFPRWPDFRDLEMKCFTKFEFSPKKGCFIIILLENESQRISFGFLSNTRCKCIYR